MILFTDYDNILVSYQCYEGLRGQFDQEVEPMHTLAIGVASRNKNQGEDEINKSLEEALSRITEVKREDFTRIMQGDKGNCEYLLTLADL